MRHFVLLGIGLFFVIGTSVSRAEESKPRAQEWRVLLVVKPETDVLVPGHPRIQARLSKTDIQAVSRAFSEHTPHWVSELTEGRLQWKPKVVVSKHGVTSVSPMGNDTFWLSPADVQDDIREHAPLAEFDGVLFYWKAVNPEGVGLNVGFGWSLGPNEAANGAGFSSVHFAPSDQWGRDTEITEVFLHEWQHQLEAFYSSKGVKLPKGGLHVDASYGYTHHPTQFWKPWYRDFLGGNVREADGTRTGLGEKAWSLGTIRDEQRVFIPDFLTPEARRKTLLRDGSFEESNPSAWTFASWRGDAETGRIVPFDKAPAGKRVARLMAAQGDDAHFRQSVQVKPRTKYLLSGRARTENVEITEKGGMTGASLSILGGFERSRQTLIQSQDWTYLCLVFDSGDRTSVDVAARLGHHGSVAKGTAWFDDLVLVELPVDSGK